MIVDSINLQMLSGRRINAESALTNTECTSPTVEGLSITEMAEDSEESRFINSSSFQYDRGRMFV